MISSILRRKGNEVATITPSASVSDAVAALADRGVGALVVSEDGEHIAGILSERDVVRSLAANPDATLGSRVADLMTKEVFTCTLENTTAELMQTMTHRRIRHVPVVEHDRLVGIVSIGDIVSRRLLELEEERRQMEQYITHG